MRVHHTITPDDGDVDSGAGTISPDDRDESSYGEIDPHSRVVLASEEVAPRDVDGFEVGRELCYFRNREPGEQPILPKDIVHESLLSTTSDMGKGPTRSGPEES